jgi:hypothetical protein
MNARKTQWALLSMELAFPFNTATPMVLSHEDPEWLRDHVTYGRNDIKYVIHRGMVAGVVYNKSKGMTVAVCGKDATHTEYEQLNMTFMANPFSTLWYKAGRMHELLKTNGYFRNCEDYTILMSQDGEK